MRIGPYALPAPVVLAPMAGVTDRPFRQLCRQLGAGLAVSEMVTADTRLWNTDKSRLRLDHSGEASPRSVQIAGADPAQLAAAARANVERGAEIIDINMGCPAKKVCNVAAGSALLQDEALVARILEAVVAAVAVPVTLKIRTGWSPQQRNGVAIARLAEQAGIAALAVHGRTRACAFRGSAEYDTIRAIKAAVRIPVIANGDITSPAQARAVLEHTGADAVMIGRAAQGRPWLFAAIAHHLASGGHLPEPSAAQVREWLLGHLAALYTFYGAERGVRIARKHLGWYCAGRAQADGFREHVNRLDTAREQFAATARYLAQLEQQEPLAA
ncbi:tRNA-U20-dihydrouridine synthase [Plasticicumulans lactativorans]|uniref:tRNA-dihydrouridine synthase B n=1 Tax=Plasticicumulans lactativorans TaxID=1133106 RepID=A0A4R2LBG4_9GAMM|nr:tRNA dihydrouridine synthase DusB [Plasticicumulans lactativorans]TCO81635.1 tRNA-U20-dihydrouridine synthase [Plasticicumulans lactativorans]